MFKKNEVDNLLISYIVMPNNLVFNLLQKYLLLKKFQKL